MNKTEVLRVIQDSKSKYSEDYMDLNYIFIKSEAVSIARYLSKLINTCFQEGIFPDSLKIASVIPLPKEGEKMNPIIFAQYLSYQLLVKLLKKLFYIVFLTILKTLKC